MTHLDQTEPSPPDDHHRLDRAVSVTVDSRADGLVAIKSGSTRSGRMALEREALVLRQLRHPNVIELIDTERTKDRCALVTEFVGRTTLADVPATGARSVARTGAELITIMLELHELGWVHGRIIGEHVIVGRDGALTLCALGAAHRAAPGDRRIGADIVGAVAVIRALSDRIEPSHDRRARAQQRNLRALLQHWELDLTDPAESARELRYDLSAIAGERPIFAKPRTVDDDPQTDRTPADGAPVRTRWRSAAVLGAALVGFLATIMALRSLGGPPVDPFAASPVTRLGSVPQPVAVALELFRIAAFIACVYGSVVSAAALGALLTRRPELERVVARIAPAPVRRVLAGLIGIGLLAGGVTDPRGPAPSSLSRAATPSVQTTETTQTTPVVPTTTSPPAPGPLTPAPVAPSHEVGLPTMWLIEPGDNLWKISAAAVEHHLGRPPTTAEVSAYWWRVIELNRHSFDAHGYPDLVRPGQIVELPPFD